MTYISFLRKPFQPPNISNLYHFLSVIPPKNFTSSVNVLAKFQFDNEESYLLSSNPSILQELLVLNNNQGITLTILIDNLCQSRLEAMDSEIANNSRQIWINRIKHFIPQLFQSNDILPVKIDSLIQVKAIPEWFRAVLVHLIGLCCWIFEFF